MTSAGLGAAYNTPPKAILYKTMDSNLDHKTHEASNLFYQKIFSLFLKEKVSNKMFIIPIKRGQGEYPSPEYMVSWVGLNYPNAFSCFK